MTAPLLPDIDRVAAIVREVGETIVMPHFRALDRADIRQKTGPNDLVTAADEEAERALTRRLADLVPGSVVVGEEAVSADPALLDRIGGDRPVWIIDPVDGTINFANGRPAFAVVVAYAVAGETLAGWIHDPASGRMATGAKGEGAFIDGRRARAAVPVPLERMAGSLSSNFCDERTSVRIRERGRALGEQVWLMSAAQEYLRLLDGATHCSLYHRLMPWDHAAGVLLFAEAGGHSALVDGRPYAPSVTGGGLLNAVDAESWQRLRTHLFG